MSPTIAAAAIGLWLAAASLPVADARELTPAQERMKTCNLRAKEKALKGPERGKFMNACLNGRATPTPLSPRQQRHEKCNALARERALQGAERRGYMTECEKPPAVKNAGKRDTARDCDKRADGRRLGGEDRQAYIKGCLNAAAESAS